MTLYRKIFSKINIQILIMLVSADYIIYFTYSVLDGAQMGRTNYSMLKYSILNLVINLLLYILFLINRIGLDKMIEKYNNKDVDIKVESIVKKTKMELNYIIASLIVFAIYASYYFVYYFFFIGMSQ